MRTVLQTKKKWIEELLSQADILLEKAEQLIEYLAEPELSKILEDDPKFLEISKDEVETIRISAATVLGFAQYRVPRLEKEIESLPVEKED